MRALYYESDFEKLINRVIDGIEEPVPNLRLESPSLCVAEDGYFFRDLVCNERVDFPDNIATYMRSIKGMDDYESVFVLDSDDPKNDNLLDLHPVLFTQLINDPNMYDERFSIQEYCEAEFNFDDYGQINGKKRFYFGVDDTLSNMLPGEILELQRKKMIFGRDNEKIEEIIQKTTSAAINYALLKGN